MSSFTEVFGGTVISPSQVSYEAITLTADTELVWPLEARTGVDLAATIIDVTTSGTYEIAMPDATLVSNGTTILFNNLGPDNVTVTDALGNGLATLLPGTLWQVYLTDNSSERGTYRTFQYGATTAQAQAASLAGAGLVAIGSLLAQKVDVSTISSGPYTITDAERAEAFIWEGALGTFNLPSASAVGASWFVNVRNGGTGDLTIDPAGAETINGDTDLRMSPGDSAVLVTDGTDWWTIGLGQRAIFAFDYTVISLDGLGNSMLSTDYTLTGSELNRIVYKFTGVLAGDIEVVVPATVQQYWFDNETTGGSYTVSIKTPGSATIIGVPRGQRGIYYSDGTVVVKADTTSGVAVPLTIAEGGTSATSASNARTSLGVAASGANADITSLSALSTPLSLAQGGTAKNITAVAGAVVYSDADSFEVTAAGTAGQVLTSNGAGAPTWQAVAGVGTVTSVAGSGGTTGMSFTGGPITSSGTLTLTGTLALANGGTGAALTDPNADRILFWDDSAGAMTWLTLGTNLTITGTTIDAAGGGGSGTVTSVAASGGTTGLSFTGSPITTSGTLTLTGTLAVANGGTGSSTAAGARSSLSAAASGTNSDITKIEGLGAGSASTPAVTFSSDPNTGMYQYAENVVGLTAGSSKVMALGFNDTTIAIGHTSTVIGDTRSVVIGRSAGTSYTYTTAPSNNVFVGYQAGVSATDGTDNVCVGSNAGAGITTGDYITCIGANAGTSLTTGQNNTVIGRSAAASSATVSNEITFGNSSIATLRCQVTTITALSDARDKDNVFDLTGALALLRAIRPVRFDWNMRDGGKVGVADTGFIAQDLQQAQAETGTFIPGLVYDENPDRLEAGYGKLIPVLVKAIQELSDKVAELESRFG